MTLYLLPDVNARLRPKLFATLRPGARIVSHDYDLGGWPPDATILVDAPDKPVNVEKTSRLHYWLVPAKIDGRWKGRAAGKAVALEVDQRYQRVSGVLRWSGREYRFSDQRIEGERLAMSLESRGRPKLELSLRADGASLVGEVREGRGRSVDVRFGR